MLEWTDKTQKLVEQFKNKELNLSQLRPFVNAKDFQRELESQATKLLHFQKQFYLTNECTIAAQRENYIGAWQADSKKLAVLLQSVLNRSDLNNKSVAKLCTELKDLIIHQHREILTILAASHRQKANGVVLDKVNKDKLFLDVAIKEHTELLEVLEVPADRQEGVIDTLSKCITETLKKRPLFSHSSKHFKAMQKACRSFRFRRKNCCRNNRSIFGKRTIIEYDTTTY